MYRSMDLVQTAFFGFIYDCAAADLYVGSGLRD